MPITTGPGPHNIYSIPPSNTPEIRHLRPKKLAQEAKASVVKLGDELKALDNSPQDLWSEEGQVMVHEMDYNRSFFQKLFGCGEKMTAIANFENGELKKLDAAVYDADHTVNGARNRNFKYEKLEDGSETFIAPRQINEWSEQVEVGRSKVSSYYREVQHFSVDYTSVQEARDGTLLVDLESDLSTNQSLRSY